MPLNSWVTVKLLLVRAADLGDGGVNYERAVVVVEGQVSPQFPESGSLVAV